MTTNIKPNFFIIGAAKSATTSIYHYLKQHPDVFFPDVKEPKFFSSKYIKFPQNGPGDEEFTDSKVFKDFDKYLKLYKNTNQYLIRGDASVDNLFYYETAFDIKKFNPDSKALVILRNPIDRAFSHYTHFIRDKRETETFETALTLESTRKIAGYEFSWLYKEVGLYAEQIKNYKNIFKDDLKVIIFEEFEKEPQKFMVEICKFLNLDIKKTSISSSVKHNSSGESRYDTLSKIVNGNFLFKSVFKKFLPFSIRALVKAKINQKFNKKLTLKQESRHELSKYFLSDILELEIILGRKLNIWK